MTAKPDIPANIEQKENAMDRLDGGSKMEDPIAIGAHGGNILIRAATEEEAEEGYPFMLMDTEGNAFPVFPEETDELIDLFERFSRAVPV